MVEGQSLLYYGDLAPKFVLRRHVKSSLAQDR